MFCGNAALTVCAPHCGHCASKLAQSLAMQPLCRSHDWTVVNHYCTPNWGLTMWPMTALTVGAPHCGHNAPKLVGLGHAAFVQKSWLDCGKSLLHTKQGSHHVFLAAMLATTDSLCPTLWPQCATNWSQSLAMQPFCRSHGWTVVNHFCTPNWGLTMCFLRQCCTHCLCPTLWPQCGAPKLVGLGHAAFVQKS